MTPDPSRARRLLFALAIGSLVVVAVTAWLATSRASEKPVPLVLASDATARAAELSTAAHTGSARVDLATSIAVSSHAGLPIEHVFLSGADGAWQPLQVDDGRIERTELKDMTRICAPGHMPAAIDAGATSIALDVDAMLVVRCPGLRACLENASPAADHRSNFASCTGFLNDDTLGCAVACVLRPAEASDIAVPFDLAWRGRLKTRIRFDAESGKTVEWKTTCPEIPPAGELVLSVVRRGAEGFVVKVAGRVEPLAGVRPVDEGSGPGATPLQSETAFPWGTAVTAWSAFDVAQSVFGGADEVRIGKVPLGAKVSLTAQDPDFGGWGMLACMHDGSEHDIVLRPPVKLHGKLSVADDSPLPDRLDICWYERFAVTDEPAWDTSGSIATVSGDGSWSVAGPRRMRCGAASSSVVPPFAEVFVTAPGFAPVTIRQSIGDVQDVDLEPIRLEPFAPDLLIRSRSNDGLDGFRNGCEISAQTGSVQIDSLRIARVWRRTDGCIAVWFRRSDRWSSGPNQDRVAAILLGTVRFVASTQWREWRGFERTADATFAEVDMDTYQLELVLPKDSERAWMRTTWFGIDCESRLLIPRADRNPVESLKMPVGPAQIRWKCASPGSEWKSAPLLPGRQRFEQIACPQETK